jgi:hypothetical protein
MNRFESRRKLWDAMTHVPLRDERDLLARVGVRYLCCTGPYFVLLWIIGLWRDKSELSLGMLAFGCIPLLGALVDWHRLASASPRLADASAPE